MKAPPPPSPPPPPPPPPPQNKKVDIPVEMGYYLSLHDEYFIR